MLTIIIPTLNAEAEISATLDAIFAPAIPDLQVIVVDGGSTDHTRAIAKKNGVHVIDSAPGRGRQLAAGAHAASNDWMLFVHADTRLPDDWPDAVSRFITTDRNRQRAGYFRLKFDDASPGAKRVAALANARAKAWGLPYGDQGLLIHRALYEEVGGFRADLNLMEDVDFARRLGPMRLKRLALSVTTSAKRYRAGGWWARPARNLACLALFLAGAPQRWIERLYG